MNTVPIRASLPSEAANSALTTSVANVATVKAENSNTKAGAHGFEFPKGVTASSLFSRQPVPSDFVLPGFVAGTIGALIAPGSTGKSMLAMQLAALVGGANTLGPDWAAPKPGKVIILAVEDPENELHNRWGSLGAHLSPEERTAGDNVQVISMYGKGFDVMIDEQLDALIRLCVGCRLLILDTFRRIHSLDENDSGQMAVVLGRLEKVAAETGTAILFLHHTSKSAAMNGKGDAQQASRGSSVLVDNIRFQLFMGVMSDDEALKYKIDANSSRSYVRAGVSKVNYGGRIGDLWLRRADGGILVPADFAKGTSQEQGRSKVNRQRTVGKGARDEA